MEKFEGTINGCRYIRTVLPDGSCMSAIHKPYIDEDCWELKHYLSVAADGTLGHASGMLLGGVGAEIEVAGVSGVEDFISKISAIDQEGGSDG